MRKLIHVDPSNVGKLHCDACGYDLPEAKSWDEFASGKLIGYRCDKCFADMLTERDWRDAMKMYRWIERINKWFGFMGSEKPGPNHVSVSARSHDGKLTIKTH